MTATAAAAWAAEHRDRQFDGMLELLRIPSVSTDPAHGPDIRRAAAALTGHLDHIGLHGVRLLEAGGHPAVYAEWLGAAGAPTVLLYGHYDVQPPDPLPSWQSPPFEPTIRDGRVYARGASDDKGPIWTMLCALEAVLAAEGALPVNVKLLLEGEEEVGSRTLPAILAEHGALLRGDALISADGGRWRQDVVSVNVNSRGMCALEVGLQTATADLHSGRFGGAVGNAATTLCRLLATLHDETGHVMVPGFHDGLRPPSNRDRASLDAVGLDEAEFLNSVGARPGAVERGVPLLEALWLRPTLEVNGIWGGYAGPGVKTVLPAEAGAKITCRLGVGQDPAAVAQAVERHLHAHCPAYATLRVTLEGEGTRAYAVPEDNWALQAVERMTEAMHGTRPLHVGVGGSLPISSMIKQHLGMETVMCSYGVADSGVHAPNEFIRISSFDDGLRAWLLLLPELARARPAAARGAAA